MGNPTLTLTRRLITRPIRLLVAGLHDRALYRIWCHPHKGILKQCHADPFKQHGLGLLPVCAACKRPLGKPHT